MPSGLRIESLGLPGSGKSTLIKACRAALADDGTKDIDSNDLEKLDRQNAPQMPVLWKQARIRHAFGLLDFIKSHPNTVDHFNTLYKGNDRNLSIIHAVGADLSRHTRLSDRYSAFWVDEGFFHYGIHAPIWAKVADPAGEVAALLKTAPRPDVLIVTKSQPQTAIAGMRKRTGASENDTTNDKKIFRKFGDLEELTLRANLIDQVGSGLAAAGTTVIELEAHGALSKMVEQVLDRLALKRR